MENTDDLGDFPYEIIGTTVEERVITTAMKESLANLVEAYLTAMADIYPPFLPGEGGRNPLSQMG